jgi:hypothetical protein
MKDPKVTELVKKFQNQLKDINNLWTVLQKEGVYIDLRAEGTHTYDDPKYFSITRITQSVEYLREK